MQNLTAAETATLLEALKLLRSVALAGEVRPVQLTSCCNAAEVVTNALAGAIPGFTVTLAQNAVPTTETMTYTF